MRDCRAVVVLVSGVLAGCGGSSSAVFGHLNANCGDYRGNFAIRGVALDSGWEPCGGAYGASLVRETDLMTGAALDYQFLLLPSAKTAIEEDALTGLLLPIAIPIDDLRVGAITDASVSDFLLANEDIYQPEDYAPLVSAELAILEGPTHLEHPIPTDYWRMQWSFVWGDPAGDATWFTADVASDWVEVIE